MHTIIFNSIFTVSNNQKTGGNGKQRPHIMETYIKSLRSKKVGYGHFEISIEINRQFFKAVTTNTMAIDAAFDDCYDDDPANADRWYGSRKEAQIALVREILRANEIEE